MSLHGTIKWFQIRKRYGFIAPDAEGDDIFVHFSNLVIAEKSAIRFNGEKVSYNVGTHENGRPIALDVKDENGNPLYKERFRPQNSQGERQERGERQGERQGQGERTTPSASSGYRGNREERGERGTRGRGRGNRETRETREVRNNKEEKGNFSHSNKPPRKEVVERQNPEKRERKPRVRPAPVPEKVEPRNLPEGVFVGHVKWFSNKKRIWVHHKIWI